MHTTVSTFESPAGLEARSAAPSAAAGAYWALRVGAALCFIGHGAFGFITKAAWLPYFSVVGIPEPWAWRLMPLIGAVDVTVGMCVLFAPRSLPLLYMSVWALWTALLRPLAGESVFEAVERAGNYGVPFALLALTTAPRTLRGLITLLDGPAGRSTHKASRILQWTTALLLIGHGALGAIVGKPALAAHYASVGLPATVVPIVGWFEIGLGVLVFVRPAAGLLLFVVAWKLATESFFLAVGAPVWEVVERAGSFAAPLALALLMRAAGASSRMASGIHALDASTLPPAGP